MTEPSLPTPVVELLDIGDPEDQERIAYLLADPSVSTVDTYDEILDELFRVDFPFVAPGSAEYAATKERYLNRRWPDGASGAGVWAFYPWRRTLVRLPAETDFFTLRTARNRYLVTPEEQHAFHNRVVGVAGLSVGLSAVLSLTLGGGPRHLRLADHDHLGLTNLNRLLGSVCQLGEPKAVSCAERVLELNPFQKLDLFAGLTDDNLEAFFGDDDEPLALFVEEIDDIRMKAVSRFAARERGIPTIMATDNGDNAMLDVERFDLEPERPLFHGTVDEELLRTIPANPNLAERVRLASAIVGADITPRTQLSLQEVGARLPAWPQLGTAAALSGVVCAYVARRILTGEEMPSGRYFVSLDAALDPGFDRSEHVASRASTRADFINNLDAMFGAKL